MLEYVVRIPSGAAADEPLPLILVLHGRGADANDLADLAPMLEPPGGARFVFPNAPKPFEPMPGYAFGYTWFEGWPPRGESLQESRALLLELIDELVRRYPTPPGKLILSGFSQGGLMSIDAGYRTAHALAAIVVMSGAIAEADMPDFEAKKDVPVLIVHGSEDDMIPVLAARRARRILEQHGIEPEYHEFPMGHHVTPESLEVVRNFMAAQLLRSTAHDSK
ncbi:MAG TPA: alpha/beta hydrolase [Thermoanaerobaculia bacterium]|nr:alpha/beta hydrolase [Thermoanaerobaculia bacterium]